MPVNDYILLRKGSSTEWSTTNPVLASGEPGFDLTNNILKIGDGVTTWSLLSQISSSDIYVYAKNTTGGSLTKGQAVYISGAQGDHPVLALASSATEGSSSKTLGLLKQDLNDNEFGYVVTEGVLTGLNTNSAGSAGDAVWLSSTPGGLLYGLANKPYAPDNLVFIGYVLRKNLNNGSIYIKVQNGFELEELHNVAVTGVSNGQFLQYNSSSGLWVGSSSGNFSTLSINGTGVSINGHTHSSTDITNFSESVDDRINNLLVEGTGVELIYNDGVNTLTINNLHTEINELGLEPQGFVNRTDSAISFNDSTRTFSIQPTGSSYTVYIEGIKVVKTGIESVVLGTGSALNYIHFDTTTQQLQTKTTPFNFETDVPISQIHWNADINQSTFFGEERHGIRMDTSTHKWINDTFGIQYVDGLSIGGYTLLGNGTSNSHAQINISDGTLYQEDIVVNIMDGDNGIEFTQQLYPTGYLPVYYHSGTTAQWIKDSGTPYPLKYNATRALYNSYSAGTWSIANVTNNRYFASWIAATNDINDPVLVIMGQREDSSLLSAENNNNWSSIDLTNIPTNEIKPLYRLIFLTNDTFTNTPKSSLQSILDLRKSIITTTYGVPQNDHGILFGLGDDDHAQYVHINEARTISANHTFTNGLTINNGLLSATSGNFTSLTVNNTGVSLSGHTHSSSDITNFNSSVSGLVNGIYAPLTGTLNQFANTTSSQLSSIISDETGSGLLVFNNSPSFTGIISATSGNFTQSLQVNGTGVSLNGHTHTVSQITDFNSGVSGLLPVKNIVAGTGIFLSSSDGIFTIHATGTTGGSNLNTEDVMDIIGTGIIGGTGISVSYDDTAGSLSVNLYASAITGYEILSTTKDTFTVTPNYLVGNLSVYYNGFKLLYGEDYTATNGSTFVLSNPGVSGDVVEWAGLGGPAQYASLNHSHGNITNSGSLGSTSGLILVTKSDGAIDVGSGLYYDSNKLGIGTNSLSGVLSLSNGYFNSDGDSKQTLLTLRNSTSNASTTTLYTDGSSSKLVLPVSGVWNFNINLTCLSISNSGAAGWNFRGCIKRNSSTTALVGSIIEENFIDSSLNGVAATVVANTGTSSLDINVNGLVSNNIRWTAATNLVQTYYG